MELTGKKILIVDYKTDLRDILMEYLETFGATVVVNENLQLGYEKFMSEDFDAIICDTMMSSSSDLDFLENIKKSNKKRPVFIIVSHYDVSRHSELYIQGASCVLKKPYDLKNIFEALIRLMQIPPSGWSRTCERHPSNLKISISEPDLVSKNEAQLINLSMKGFRIASSKKIPNVSKMISFELGIPTNAQKISGTGIVRWIKYNDIHGDRAGFGLEIVEINAESANEYKNYINSLSFV
jgi:DNA-binding response OmpR family regulator